MLKLDVLADQGTFEDVAKACAARGLWQDALNVLRMTVVEDMPPSLSIHNSVIGACVRTGRWKHALAVLESLAWHELEPDSVSFDNALQCVCKSPNAWTHPEGDLRDVLLEKELASVGSSQASCRTAMRACLRRGCWQQAMLAFQAFELPDPETTAVAISAGRWRWQVAMELLEVLRSSRGCSREAHRAAAEAYVQGGVPDRALSLKRSLSGRTPDAVICSAAISCCDAQQVGQWKPQLLHETLNALEQDSKHRRAMGLPPDLPAFRAAISACGECSQADSALNLLDELAGFSVEPPAEAYNSAVCVCSNAGKAVEVAGLLEEMRTWQVQPDAAAYVAGVIAYWQDDEALARQLYKESLRCGVGEQWLMSPKSINVSALSSDIAPTAVRWFLGRHSDLDNRAVGELMMHTDIANEDVAASICRRDFGVEAKPLAPGVLTVGAAELRAVTRRNVGTKRTVVLGKKTTKNTKPLRRLAQQPKLPRRPGETAPLLRKRTLKRRRLSPEDLAFSANLDEDSD